MSQGPLGFWIYIYIYIHIAFLGFRVLGCFHFAKEVTSSDSSAGRLLRES